MGGNLGERNRGKRCVCVCVCVCVCICYGFKKAVVVAVGIKKEARWNKSAKKE